MFGLLSSREGWKENILFTQQVLAPLCLTILPLGHFSPLVFYYRQQEDRQWLQGSVWKSFYLVH